MTDLDLDDLTRPIRAATEGMTNGRLSGRQEGNGIRPSVSGVNGMTSALHGADPGEIERREALEDLVADAPALLDVVPMTSHRSERLRWAWTSMVPLGELTLLAGMEKVGKSLLLVELSARLTRGDLDGDLAGRPTRVLYLTSEDRYAQTVKPRLMLAGADLSMVYAPAPADDMPFVPGRVAEIVARHEIGVVMLDPLVSYLDDVGDEAGDAKTRKALSPWQKIAQANGVSVVAIKHLSKGTGRSALNRVNGSRAYTAAARSIMFAVDDPDAADRLNPDRLLFGMGNVAATAKASRYRIEAADLKLDDGEMVSIPRIVCKGKSPVTLNDAFASSDKAERGDESDSHHERRCDWLREWLDAAVTKESVTGAPVTRKAAPSRLVLEHAREEHGWQTHAMRRAAEEIGAVKVKLGRPFHDEGAGWWWARDEEAAERLRDAYDDFHAEPDEREAEAEAFAEALAFAEAAADDANEGLKLPPIGTPVDRQEDDVDVPF